MTYGGDFYVSAQRDRLAKRVIWSLRSLRDRVERVTRRRISRATISAWVDGSLARLLKRRIEARVRLVEEHELRSTFHRALELLSRRVGRAGIGDYLEFGVYNGTSMLCMFRALEETGLKNVRLVGFDSFEGLPPDVEGAWRTGEFATSFDFTHAVLSFSGVDWSRIELIRGWFRDTLTKETARRYGIEKAGVIMIDCDLYEATREALRFCRPLIKDEALIVFDDWRSGGLDERRMGERRAFEEFLEADPQISTTYIDELSNYSDRAAVFHVTVQPPGAVG